MSHQANLYFLNKQTLPKKQEKPCKKNRENPVKIQVFSSEKILRINYIFVWQYQTHEINSNQINKKREGNHSSLDKGAFEP